jgi:hypothetical protein
MRRKPGGLVPLEQDICIAGFDLKARGIEEFHGYQLAKMLKDEASHRLLTAYGTLYRALFLAALLLFVLTFVVNTAAEVVRQRLRTKYAQL